MLYLPPPQSVAQYFERFFEHSTLGFASQRSFLRKTKKAFAHNLHTISDPIDHVDVELFFHAVGDVDSMDMVSRVTLLELSLPHVSSCLVPTIPWNSFVRSFGRYAIRGILFIIYYLWHFVFQNFITTIYLTQVWYDRHLNIGWLGRQEPYLSIHFSDTEWIWRPDTFFKNELEALKHDNTRENLLLRILMWPSPWCVTLTLLMTYSHIQRINMLK